MEERVKQVIEKLGIRAKVEHGAKGIPDDFKECDPWTVTLTNKEKRQITVPFFKGLGHHGTEPTAEEVLECLASDSAGYENAKDFEDWCDEYGYNTDSREAERIYKACGHEAEKLKRFLGQEAYAFLLWDEEVAGEI